MTRTVLQADIEKDPAAMDHVIHMLSELLSSWKALSTREDNPVVPTGAGNVYSDNRTPREHAYISA
jgi:flagellin-specific chaperone FliS